MATRISRASLAIPLCLMLLAALPTHAVGPAPSALDPNQIGAIINTKATTAKGGVVRVAWARTDVPVRVDNLPLAPAAGLSSWAAFKPNGKEAIVMGDTVVFQDEVDAAMDAALRSHLDVTALHNHFFYDEPRVYFMHIEGQGDPQALAKGVRSMWDAIKAVRARRAMPAEGFGGPVPKPGAIDAKRIGEIVGREAKVTGGVVKVTVGRKGVVSGVEVGDSMGLNTWAAFEGSDGLAVVDGDFIMAPSEVQSVLRAMRNGGIHIVALHNHMLGDQPQYYFLHYWGKGRAADLAKTIRAALYAEGQLMADCGCRA